MISNSLSVEDHQFASEYAVMLRNLVPMLKNAGPDGHGVRPLTAISGGRLTNRFGDNAIDSAAALALVNTQTMGDGALEWSKHQSEEGRPFWFNQVIAQESGSAMLSRGIAATQPP